MNKKELTIFSLVSAALLYTSWKSILPMGVTEVLGFITGAACVWLTVKQNIWNWPIGIANNVFFIVLFLQARLFADMGLQVVYIVLGILGWYWWLKGGENKTELKVSHVGINTVLILLMITILTTFGMTVYLRQINDSAPFWDALTTVMSLVAQYLLTRKILENWYVWISADVIYIWLYAYKGLYLTSVLYALFLCMCIVGLMQWRKSLMGGTK
ncbi:MAG: nicotinamide riboside transporter PnuC [Microgenomates group bacterium]|jgi:nicotinamide mononucleotide transporter